jgi:CO/xanthine dehydrogenase FAD-binding subunit
MQEAHYERPTTVAEASALLAGNNGSATILAGGTDVLVQLRLQSRVPAVIVDIKHIPQTRELQLDAAGLLLGAAVPAVELAEHAQARKLFPGLVEAAELIGSTQIQSRASVGGNLCNAGPAADTVPALFVLAAECIIAGANGERRVAVTEFTTGVGKNCLQPGEFLVALWVPAPAAKSSSAYLRFIPRNEMDIAVVGAGANITLDTHGTCTAAKLSLGAVATTAIMVPEAGEALVGSKIEESDLATVAELASAASRPISDRRGTAEFRRHISGVLARRSVVAARDRARLA